MKAFVLAIATYIAIESILKLILITLPTEPPPRPKGLLAADLVINVCVIVWASVLLWGNA